MARPLKQISPRQVIALAQLHCTNQEMATLLGCSADTLERRFAVEMSKGRESGRKRLRRVQWKAAMRGNVAMMIWLGKQMLGQSEKVQQQVGGIEGGAPIKHQYTIDENKVRELWQRLGGMVNGADPLHKRNGNGQSVHSSSTN